MGEGKLPISRGKLRVQFDGALKEGNGGRVTFQVILFIGQGIGSQRIERRGRHPVHRNIVFLYRGKGFPELLAEFRACRA